MLRLVIFGDYNTKFKAKKYVQVGGHGKKNLHL